VIRIRHPVLGEISAELAVLLDLAQIPESAAGAAITAPAGIDWRRLQELADRHGLYVHLSEAVSRGRLAPCPPAVHESLRSGHRMRHLMNVLLEARLAEVIVALRAADVTAIALKGPALDQLLYGGARLRQYSDLDIWVPPEQVALAARRLKDLGFATEVDVRDPVRHPVLRDAGEMVFSRPGAADLEVDLHWRLFPRSRRDCPPLTGFRERLRSLSIASAEVATLGARDLLQYLCHHAVKDGCARLSHLHEVGLLLRQAGTVVCERLLAEAPGEKFRLAFSLPTYLAAKLLGAEVPHGIVESVERMPRRARLLDHLRSSWEHVDAATASPRFLQRVVEPSAIDHARLLLDEAMIPRIADWRALPLEQPLAELYVVIRPLRLLLREIRSLARTAISV